MGTLRNAQQSIGRILGRTIAVTAISAIAVTSFSAQATEVEDTYSVAEAARTATKINELKVPAAVGFNFKLGGLGGFGRSDFYYEEEKQQFERSSAFDQSRSNPYDNGNEKTFGSSLDYEAPIYRSNNSDARGSFNSVNR